MVRADLFGFPEDGDHSEKERAHAKSPNALKTISEAADLLDVPQHVLRFWETKFSQIKPLKRSGGRRYYRPEDIDTLLKIKNLLYKQGYTIKGAKKFFEKKHDAVAVQGAGFDVPEAANDASPADAGNGFAVLQEALADSVGEMDLPPEDNTGLLQQVRQSLVDLKELLQKPRS